MRKCLLGLTAICAVVVSSTLHAAVVLYPDLPSWNTAVPVSSNSFIPDPADDFDVIGSGTASITYDNVLYSTDGNLSDENFFNIGSGFSGLSAVLSVQEGTFGVNNILVTFPTPVTAFAMSFGTFGGTDVDFALSNGDTFTLPTTQTFDYDVVDFAGVTDDVPFTSVLLTGDFEDVMNLNNVSYGSAPEPTSLGVIALGGTAMLRRRRA